MPTFFTVRELAKCLEVPATRSRWARGHHHPACGPPRWGPCPLRRTWNTGRPLAYDLIESCLTPSVRSPSLTRRSESTTLDSRGRPGRTFRASQPHHGGRAVRARRAVPALRLAPRCACLRSGRGGPTELFGSNSRVNAHALIEDTMCPQREADPLSPGRPHAFPHGRLTSTVYPAIQSVDLGTCFEGSSRGGPQGRSLPSPASAATRCRALGLRFAWGRNPSDFAAWARFRTPKPPKTSRQPHCGKARVSELFFCTRAYRWILYLLILRAYGDRPRTCASGETFMYSATSHLSAAVTTILGRPSTETSQ